MAASTILASGAIGYALGRMRVVSGTVAIWGSRPGGVAALVLSSLCGLIALALHVALGIDPLTVWLATNSGGLENVAIITTSLTVERPFIMAAQTARFGAVMLIGPHSRPGSHDAAAPPLASACGDRLVTANAWLVTVDGRHAGIGAPS